MIGPDDRGLTLGDGLFETLLAVNGVLQAEAAHMARLTKGCAALGLPEPDLGLARRLMAVALADAGLTTGRAAVRLTWTAGAGGRGLDRPALIAPRMLAAAAPAPRPTAPARLAISRVRRNEGSPASRLKTLAYLDNVLARREAAAAGADEAVMLNNAGHLACAAAANLFWLRDGRLFTPAPDCGVLEGVMRAALIAEAGRRDVEVVEVRAAPEVLAQAEAVFITNSLIGVRVASSLDGLRLPTAKLVEDLVAAI